MKLSELKPCDCCSNPITGKSERNITFKRITVDATILHPRKLQRNLGMMAVMGGHLGISEAMIDDSEVTESMGKTEIFLCQDCANGTCGGDFTKTCLPIAVITEAVEARQEKSKEV